MYEKASTVSDSSGIGKENAETAKFVLKTEFWYVLMNSLKIKTSKQL